MATLRIEINTRRGDAREVGFSVEVNGGEYRQSTGLVFDERIAAIEIIGDIKEGDFTWKLST